MAKSTSYNTSGNREDLTDIISVLEPDSTRFVSSLKKGKATGTFFEYQVDKLNSPEFDGVSEGEDVGNFKNQSADRARIGNFIQKFRDTFMVSDIQEMVDTAGVASEFANAESKAVRNVKRSIESAFCSSQERQASDQQAAQTFEFLSDGESEDYKMFMQVKASPLYKPLVEHLPNSNFALGLMVEGLKAVKARQANAGQPKKLKKPTAPVASAEAGASKPRSEGSKHKKAVQAAHAKFEKSGNIADYQHYIKLKRSIA